MRTLPTNLHFRTLCPLLAAYCLLFTGLLASCKGPTLIEKQENSFAIPLTTEQAVLLQGVTDLGGWCQASIYNLKPTIEGLIRRMSNHGSLAH